MAITQNIPAGCKPLPAEVVDTRTDEEIAETLQKRQPITSEKNVWAFWHSGWKNMHPWEKRNTINWARRLGPSWTVRVANRVPGDEMNISNFVEDEWFPQTFLENKMDGPFVGVHTSDLIRLPLLYKYGGAWLDVGIILLRSLEHIGWSQIEDPDSPIGLAGFGIEAREGEYTFLNSFIASHKGNEFVRRWHKIYQSLWEGGRTNALGFHKHPLLAHLPVFDPPLKKLNVPDLNTPVGLASDYLAQFLCFERLRGLVDPADGFDGTNYYANHIFLTDAAKEAFNFQISTGWKGLHQYDMLCLKRDEEAANQDNKELWQEANQLVNKALSSMACIKLAHGPGGKNKNLSLADIWDTVERQDDDSVPGTFASYLRYGSGHFEQTREVEQLKIEKIGNPLRLGFLEPKAVEE